MKIGTPERNEKVIREVMDGYVLPGNKPITRQVIAEVAQASGPSAVCQWLLPQGNPHRHPVRDSVARLVLLELGIVKPAYQALRKRRATR